jgi:hypothetical protein
MVSVNEDSEHQQGWLRQDPAQVQEWLRQNNLIYGGLIGIGVVLVQPFLTAASLDLSAKICVVAFSVAIPLLAALVLVNRQEVFRRRVTRSVLVEIARAVAQVCAFVGVVAGFWHILWIAGVGCWHAGSLGWWFTRQATCAWNGSRSYAPGRRRTRRHRVIAPSTYPHRRDQRVALTGL